MINTKNQAFFTLFIVVGAALLVYDLAFESEGVYLKVIGLILLMFGLYSSTRQWASDNDRNKEESKSIDDTNELPDDFEFLDEIEENDEGKQK